MSEVPYTVEIIEKLRWNAHLGKHKHFEAAKRGRNYHELFGIPIVVINLLIGSVFFAYMSIDLSTWAKWVGAVLALLAALLGGIQTFFHFQKEYEGHRQIGNKYLSIARECERLLALHYDGILSLDKLSKEIEKLNSQYNDINITAESYTVTERDYQKALSYQQGKLTNEPSFVERIRTYQNQAEPDPASQPVTPKL